jgi:hypothetical protein
MAHPDDMKLRSRLGDVYIRLGYPEEAGRFWFLDEDLTDEKRSAIDVFILRCHRNPSLILKRLKLRCSPERLTTSHARQRVEQLVEDCRKRGFEVPTFGARGDSTRPRTGLWGESGCMIATLVLIFLIGLGAYTVYTWIAK